MGELELSLTSDGTAPWADTTSKWLITARLAQSGSRGDVVPPRLGGQR